MAEGDRSGKGPNGLGPGSKEARHIVSVLFKPKETRVLKWLGHYISRETDVEGQIQIRFIWFFFYQFKAI